MSDFLPATASFEERWIPREKWGARAPKSGGVRLNAEGSTLHWEGPHMRWPWGHASCYAKVRGIQAFHMDPVARGGRNWADIAYSTIECGHGYIFEGRGFGVRTAANGTNEGNARSHAHCYLGGEGDPFTDEGKMAQRHAVAYFARLGGGAKVWAHRDWKATMCNGPDGAAFVHSGEAAQHPDITTTTPLPEEDDDMPKPTDKTTHPCPTGGFWLLAADGGIETKGDAPFFGSIFNVPAEGRVLAEKEYFNGLVPVWNQDKTGLVAYILVTNHGDTYDSRHFTI